MRSNFDQAYSARTIDTPAVKRVSALAFLLGLAVSGAVRHAEAEEPSAAAQEKLACSQSFEQAQRLRNDTKYLAANEELLKCANPKCGEALFQECSKLYAELQAAIPSVVFEARDSVNGQELIDVTVTSEGTTLTQQLNGKPVVVDPGSHTFTFLMADSPPVEKVVVVRAGEKYRQIVVVLDVKGSKAAAVTATPVAPLAPTEPVLAPRHVPVGSYVLGGIGALALGGFVAFRVIGGNDYDTLANECVHSCTQAQVDKVQQKYLISNIALGIGAAALVGSVVVYLAQSREPSGSETALVITPVADGMFARAVTRF